MRKPTGDRGRPDIADLVFAAMMRECIKGSLASTAESTHGEGDQ